MATSTTPDNQREYILRTTCNKNGGFRFYVPLPPQRVFQKAYWVLGSELEVRIKRKSALFNRETKWMRVPIYLTTNKGLLFVYITEKSGYILRVPCATKLFFEGVKKAKKIPKNKILEGNKYNYIANMHLTYNFGELHIRFDDEDNLRPWRAIMLAAHQTPHGLAKAGVQVAREVCKSTSAESVVSTKSIAPEGKNKDDEIRLRRYAAFPRKSASELSVASRTSSQVSTHINLTAAITSARASASGTSIMSNVSKLSRVSGMPTMHAEPEELEPLINDHDLEEEQKSEIQIAAAIFNELSALSTTKSSVSALNTLVAEDDVNNDGDDDITQSLVSTFSNSVVEQVDETSRASSEVDVEIATPLNEPVAPIEIKIESPVKVEPKKSENKFVLVAPTAVKSNTSIHTAIDGSDDINLPEREDVLKDRPVVKRKPSVTFAALDSVVPFGAIQMKVTQKPLPGKKPGILRPNSQNAPPTANDRPVNASNLKNKIEFWRNRELVHGTSASATSKPVIIGKTVQQKVKFINAKNEDNMGKVVTSPTRFFGSVEDAAAAVTESEETIHQESHI